MTLFEYQQGHALIFPFVIAHGVFDILTRAAIMVWLNILNQAAGRVSPGCGSLLPLVPFPTQLFW